MNSDCEPSSVRAMNNGIAYILEGEAEDFSHGPMETGFFEVGKTLGRLQMCIDKLVEDIYDEEILDGSDEFKIL